VLELPELHAATAVPARTAVATRPIIRGAERWPK
jgi:hypothetical protein